MILSDKDIKKRIEAGNILINPYSEDMIQPASYDLHLGNQFKIFIPHSATVIDPKESVSCMMDNIHIGDDDFFVLHPKCFALALVKEKTGVDSKHVGRLEGKSSLARLGLIIHTTAGFLDPGNDLNLTLELFNASPLPIKLYPNMKVAQIAFEEISSACEKPYGSSGLNSKYSGDEGVQESKMHLNFGN
ncbi:MAG: dCTP deaminase [Nanoarchaeota archaeon]|jgi:dCTP deaminase|nr:dCTP deaminase [Nanoarchaeota archaeon]